MNAAAVLFSVFGKSTEFFGRCALVNPNGPFAIVSRAQHGSANINLARACAVAAAQRVASGILAAQKKLHGDHPQLLLNHREIRIGFAAANEEVRVLNAEHHSSPPVTAVALTAVYPHASSQLLVWWAGHGVRLHRVSRERLEDLTPSSPRYMTPDEARAAPPGSVGLGPVDNAPPESIEKDYGPFSLHDSTELGHVADAGHLVRQASYAFESGDIFALTPGWHLGVAKTGEEFLLQIAENAARPAEIERAITDQQGIRFSPMVILRADGGDVSKQ